MAASPEGYSSAISNKPPLNNPQAKESTPIRSRQQQSNNKSNISTHQSLKQLPPHLKEDSLFERRSSEYVGPKHINLQKKTSKTQDILWDAVNELQDQLKTLRLNMNKEIEVLKLKVHSLEVTQHRSFKDFSLKSSAIENIEEEYKSRQKQINELSINIDTPPILTLDLKRLESNEPFHEGYNTHNLLSTKLKSTIQHEKKTLKSNTKKNNIKDHVKQHFYQAILSPTHKHEDIETEKGTLKHIAPMSSNYKGGMKELDDCADIKMAQHWKQNLSQNAMTLSERIQSNNFLNHLQNKTQDTTRNNESNTFNSTPFTPPQQKQRMDEQLRQQQSLVLGSNVIDSPKFMQFVHANSGRRSDATNEEFQGRVASYTQSAQQMPKTSLEKKLQEICMSPVDQKQRYYPTYLQTKNPVNQDKQTKQKQDKNNTLMRSYINNKPPINSRKNPNDSGDSIDSADCDEKRSYTPEPRHQDLLTHKDTKSQLNHSMIGLRSSASASGSVNILAQQNNGINTVYKSQNMELSRYISKNKSNIDYQNSYNLMEFGGYKALIENKGSRCACANKQIIQSKSYGPDESLVNCGNYCKNLLPQEQKKILLESLKKEQEEHQSSRGNNQKKKRYLIDAKWWRQWCDYTNFDGNLMINPSLDEIQEHLRDSTLASKQDTQRRYDSSTLYAKPKKIVNDNLLDHQAKNNAQRLRENLIEHFDFEIMSPQLWLFLYSWYSADCQIVRYLKRDKLNSNQFILDLYPHHKQEKMNLSYIGPSYDESSSDDSGEDRMETEQNNEKDFGSPILRQKKQVVTQLKEENATSKLFGNQINRLQKQIQNKSQELLSIMSNKK